MSVNKIGVGSSSGNKPIITTNDAQVAQTKANNSNKADKTTDQAGVQVSQFDNEAAQQRAKAIALSSAEAYGNTAGVLIEKNGQRYLTFKDHHHNDKLVEINVNSTAADEIRIYGFKDCGADALATLEEQVLVATYGLVLANEEDDLAYDAFQAQQKIREGLGHLDLNYLTTCIVQLDGIEAAIARLRAEREAYPEHSAAFEYFSDHIDRLESKSLNERPETQRQLLNRLLDKQKLAYQEKQDIEKLPDTGSEKSDKIEEIQSRIIKIERKLKDTRDLVSVLEGELSKQNLIDVKLDEANAHLAAASKRNDIASSRYIQINLDVVKPLMLEYCQAMCGKFGTGPSVKEKVIQDLKARAAQNLVGKDVVAYDVGIQIEKMVDLVWDEARRSPIKQTSQPQPQSSRGIFDYLNGLRYGFKK